MACRACAALGGVSVAFLWAIGCSSGSRGGTATNGTSSATSGTTSTSGSTTTGSSSSSGSVGTGDAGFPGTVCVLPDGGAGSWCDAYSVFSICVDTSRDPLNCGGCGNACLAGQTCNPGASRTPVCVFTDCQQAVPGGDNGDVNCLLADGGQGGCCAGACQDPTFFTTSATNCGLCGIACAPGVACQGGICPAACEGLQSCPAGYGCTSNGDCLPSCTGTNDNTFCDLDGGYGVCCRGACGDLTHDPENCGACGQACAAGTVCAHSSCLPASTCSVAAEGLPCDLGSGREGACCAGACVDTTSAPSNCGTCGTACPDGLTCLPSDVGSLAGIYDATCVLPDGGTPTACTPGLCPEGELCGAASPPGVFCAPVGCEGLPLGTSCFGGPTTLSLCCAEGCTDITQDPANCGFCGNLCASGICVEGNCLPTSSAGLPSTCSTNELCSIEGSAGLCCQTGDPDDPTFTCTNIGSDPNNCGSCANACPAGQTCVQGNCSGYPEACRGRTGAFCDLDAGTGSVCCFPGGCTDLTQTSSCGECGNLCDQGAVCAPFNGGLACSCPNGGIDCGGGGGCLPADCGAIYGCTDPLTDPNNCGGCGQPCGDGQQCTNGVCS